MAFPTVLQGEHRLFDFLVQQRTEWCQPTIKGILDGHFRLLSVSHKVVASIQMSWLIFGSCVLFYLTFLSVCMIQFWLWFTRRICLLFFSTQTSLCKLSFTSWCPQFPSIKDCIHNRKCNHCRELSEEILETNKITFFDHFTTVIFY